MLVENVRGSVPGVALAVCLLVSTRAVAQPVSLPAILAHADEHAPALVAARARLEEGAAAMSGAERLLTDPLSIEVGVGPRTPDSFATVDVDVVVSLMQPIEIAGERGLRIAAAARLEDRREAELEAIRWHVHREVHFAFHEAVEARVRLEADTRWLELAESLAAIARGREEAGDIGPLEVAVATAELAAARQRHIESEARFVDARLAIAELAGWPAADPPLPAGDLDSPGAVPGDSALVERALDAHPLLRALAAAVADARARLELADREAIPTLDIGLTFAREGASPGNLVNYVGLLVIGIDIPVWNPDTEERAMARAAVSVAEAELEALRSTIEARVLRAATSLRAARERVAIFTADVLPGFERNLALLQQAFELGELDALEVGAATRRLLEVQGNALDAFAEYHRALAELEAQVGAEVIADPEHGDGVEPADATDREGEAR